MQAVPETFPARATEECCKEYVEHIAFSEIINVSLINTKVPSKRLPSEVLSLLQNKTTYFDLFAQMDNSLLIAPDKGPHRRAIEVYYDGTELTLEASGEVDTGIWNNFRTTACQNRTVRTTGI